MSTGPISSAGFAILGDGGCSGPHCKKNDYLHKPVTHIMYLRDKHLNAIDLNAIDLNDMSRNNLWMSSITQSQSRLFQC